ncbi:hypothetical protein BU25DRAFT_340761 [Macroventuria anomochaeta]|uniref:Uncharacterized protein n=1 Tax=Macroventuria anomochaeta TaxID=301207 RepID=A0ACB6S407_9PLEO|nr:uncharacterized protein BU25DRAFT_340761 [Macroventuria anomochaeta]KAF2627939.1 hypothetical protein BU25DRAFT_340761 [Macroventuria anomochaeta]
MADAEKPWGRRLIVCCDGTWQSSVSDKENVPSNVTKLCRVLARTGKDDKNRNWHQVVYYDGGIGTGNLSGTEAVRQGGTGAGLAENVIEAYNFIVLNYQPGDEIFCFGFSRGAYTARAVAGLVADIGVLQPLEMQFFPQVYRAYMGMNSNDGTSFAKSDAWKILTGQKADEFGKTIALIKKPVDMEDDKTREIKVIGVWDTVGSLGVPNVGGIDHGRLRKKFGFHNVKLSSRIKHAYHALALDERREAFRPTLWYIDTNSYLKGGQNEKKEKPELKQVWFPGVHINCGGGSDDGFLEMKGDMENISVATLTWMLQCIAPHLDVDRTAFQEYLNQYEAWLTDVRKHCTYHHIKDEGYIEWAWNKVPDVPYIGHEPSPLDPPKRAKTPHEHKDFDFGWGVGPIVDSFTKMYHLNGTRPRQPGHEEMEINGEWVPIAGIKGSKDHPPTGYETNEYIHPLVQHRFEIRDWQKYSWPFRTTPPLEGWERWYEVGLDKRQRYWWQKNSDKPNKEGRFGKKLPEWAILPHPSTTEKNFERMWYEAAQRMGHSLSQIHKKRDEGKEDYLQALDKNIDFKLGAKAQNE